MSSIQAAVLARPLPFSEKAAANPFTPKPNAPQPNQDPAKVAKDFESLFTSMMLKEMRSTLESGSLFAEDPSDVYGGMFDQFLGEHIAETGGIGMAQMVRAALDREMKGSQKTAQVKPKAI